MWNSLTKSVRIRYVSFVGFFLFTEGIPLHGTGTTAKREIKTQKYFERKGEGRITNRGPTSIRLDAGWFASSLSFFPLFELVSSDPSS